MTRSLPLLLALVFAMTTPGCAAGRPGWFPAGPVASQQQRAVLFDPYPDNVMGPEVVGGRPLAFQKPLSEPTKAKLFWESRPFWVNPFQGTLWGAPAPAPGGAAAYRGAAVPGYAPAPGYAPTPINGPMAPPATVPQYAPAPTR